MLKHLICILGLIFLTGCASVSGVNPDSLTKPGSITEFTLEEDVADIMTVTNAFGTKSTAHSGLAKGRYVSKYEDENGIYYEGPKGCLISNKHTGGLYLPKKGAEGKPAFWFYIRGLPENERVKAGVIVAIGDSWEAGRVKKDWWTTVSDVLLNAVKLNK